ncbi:MAG: glycoside hydrolase family 97 C-terminal domain-containing protein [Mediterranea sp.]|nr:glycoside hydrolase family 97 C-terminal domain-containing protein [Mediterranea sp.]
MKLIPTLILCLFVSVSPGAQTLKSPDGNLSLTFSVNDEGAPTYGLYHKITDENARTASINLGFLPEGKNYTATVYTDGK